MFHLLIELQKAEALHECYAFIYLKLFDLNTETSQCQKIWKIVFNDFEAHSGCFSWIVNSLHYLE